MSQKTATMITRSCPSRTYRIWIAGDYARAQEICRAFCMEGFCVALQPADYIYTMGLEAGVCVTAITYPRIPYDREVLEDKVMRLGQALLEGLCQGSFTIEGPEEMTFVSRRPQDHEG